MQSEDFATMLLGIEQKGQQQQKENTDPCVAVRALEDTLESLRRIQADLKQTKEYRAAQEEKKRSDQGDRVQKLNQTIDESRAAAEKMLGFPLTSNHLGSNAYKLMPVGFVDRLIYEANVNECHKEIARMEAIIKIHKAQPLALKVGNGGGFGFNNMEQIRRTIEAAEHTIGAKRSQMLGFVMEHRPMLDATFSERLACHLDAMLDAYLSLRTLEAGLVVVVVDYDEKK
jgi:hypothetical protein